MSHTVHQAHPYHDVVGGEKNQIVNSTQSFKSPNYQFDKVLPNLHDNFSRETELTRFVCSIFTHPGMAQWERKTSTYFSDLELPARKKTVTICIWIIFKFISTALQCGIKSTFSVSSVNYINLTESSSQKHKIRLLNFKRLPVEDQINCRQT